MKEKTISYQPKVSIVFVTWNGKKYTFDLIKSLKKIDYKNYDIIVVDNGSVDGTQKEFKKKFGKSITLIENKKNLGLAEGTNVGIREGLRRKSEYILTLNNDMVVEKKFLNFLVEAIEKHPGVAAVGPKIYYMEPKNMIWSAGCDYHLHGFTPKNQNEIDKGQTEDRKYVDALDCVLMIRSDILKKIGPLDSEFFIINEITGWCLKAKKLGYKLLYVPKSITWHKVAGSVKGEKNNTIWSVYYSSRNWLLLIKKNKNLFYFLFILVMQSTIFGLIRFLKYLKIKQPFLIKTYYVAIWHALINKTPLELYPYSK